MSGLIAFRKNPPVLPTKSQLSNSTRANSANAMVSNANWTPRTENRPPIHAIALPATAEIAAPSRIEIHGLRPPVAVKTAVA